MKLEGKRRSTNIEDRRGQTPRLYSEVNVRPSYRKPVDRKLDDVSAQGARAMNDAERDYATSRGLGKSAAVLKGVVDVPSKKAAGAIADGVIKVRQKLGYRNYADGGKVKRKSK